MNKLILILMMIAFQSFGATQEFNAPNLGKTHFILGLPTPPPLKLRKINLPANSSNLEQRLACHDGCYKQAFFSPDDNVQEILVQLIAQEKKSIKIAIFSFTDGKIAHALLDAAGRGVHVEIIVDASGLRDKFSKIDILKESGIKVTVYDPKNNTVYNNIMHHKFVIFGNNIGGKSLLWTGSYNFTKSATMNNQENVLVLDEIHLIQKYAHQFELIKDRTKNSRVLAHNKGKKVTV
jgi:phosphatidylserine/phosphatidylglycerophosphate/cardiolipin synthase-like enzyme